jgi:methylated-DNA-[protein]-cysteine S-methyltransferase
MDGMTNRAMRGMSNKAKKGMANRTMDEMTNRAGDRMTGRAIDPSPRMPADRERQERTGVTALHARLVASPVGELRLVASDAALVAALFMTTRHPLELDASPAAPHPVLDIAERELEEYFAGTRTVFETALSPWGGTGFQRAVWAALRDIPFAETRSYGQIAAAVGRPSAVRAVGAANGQNPLALFIPCHRVIGGDGTLTGYGGGIENKRWLLAHEHRVAQGRTNRLI